MDELEAVGDPELRSTLLWARTQERPVTADDVATAQALHRNVARSRLERLVRAGLLRSTYERRTGRRGPGAGRPAKLYAVSPQLESIEFPARRYESLIGLLLEALPADAKPERLGAIGAEFGRQLGRSARLRPARSLEKASARVCTALGGLGFQVAVVELTPERAVLATPTCPLRPLIRAQPQASELDRGMWSGLVTAAVAGLTVGDVVCETRDCHDTNASCRVAIALRKGRFLKPDSW